MDSATQHSRKVEETRTETGKLKLPIAFWALMWTILMVVLGGVWQASGMVVAMQKDVAAVGRDVANVARAVLKLEQRIDVDNQTRYTTGDASRDLGSITATLSRLDRKYDDHETRLRAVELSVARSYVGNKNQ